MSSEAKAKLQDIDGTTITNSLTAVLDSSAELTSTSISALSNEYKHLDELIKMMILKLKDIHQQILKDGNEWYDKRSEILDGLSPFFTDIDTLHDNSEALLKMVKKIDAYTKSLETRANALF